MLLAVVFDQHAGLDFDGYLHGFLLGGGLLVVRAVQHGFGDDGQ